MLKYVYVNGINGGNKMKQNFGMGLITGIRDIIRKLNTGANIVISAMGLLAFGSILVYFNMYASFFVRLLFWLLVMGKTYVYCEQHEWNNSNHELVNKFLATIMLIVAVGIALI